MNLQIYAHKRNFDVQKAERYFKERRVKYQYVDLSRHPMGRRELESVIAKVGLKAVIDESNSAYLEHPVRFMTGRETIIDALLTAQHLLKTPIVRNAPHATVGYAPEVWVSWT